MGSTELQMKYLTMVLIQTSPQFRILRFETYLTMEGRKHGQDDFGIELQTTLRISRFYQSNKVDDEI